MKYFVFMILLLFSCDNTQTIVKKYKIDAIPIQEIIQLPIQRNGTILEIEIVGNVNTEILFSYSHSPFEIESKIVLYGIIDKKIRTDWYDNQCKICIDNIHKKTSGTLKIKFKYY